MPAIDLAAAGALHARVGPSARAAEVLRLLGRLEFVGTHWLRALIFPDCHRVTAWRALEMLHAQRLVWRAGVAPDKLPGAMRWPRGQALPDRPHIYGLTPAGRDWLAAQGAEPDPRVLETFVVRDHAKPEVKTAQLAHDLLVVDWCASAIDHARRCPLVTGIRCRLEYVSLIDERGQAYQRFDALVVLTFDAGRDERQAQPGWRIPWDDQVRRDAGTVRAVRLAIELDRGTEKLATLMAKAITYAQLTGIGHYTATLGGPALPVVIAPPGRRGPQIAHEWRDGWPGGAGVISSFTHARHPQHGALWGRYYTLTDAPARQVDLLAETGLTLGDWTQLTAAWQPGLPGTQQL